MMVDATANSISPAEIVGLKDVMIFCTRGWGGEGVMRSGENKYTGETLVSENIYMGMS